MYSSDRKSLGSSGSSPFGRKKPKLKQKTGQDEKPPADNADILKQKLKIRDSKLETLIQISKCFYEELQKVSHEADFLK